MPTSTPGPAVARRQLRSKLRRARTAAGKTQGDVADALDWSASKVLRIENGQVAVQTSDLVALLTQYGVPDTADVEEMIALARASRQPTVSSRYQDVLTKEFAEWLDYEAYATVIRQFETKLIPGPLQINGYAVPVVRALMGQEVDEGKADRIVAMRLERAEYLTGPDGPEMSFIIDEAALRRGVGNETGKTGYATMLRLFDNLKLLNTKGRKALGEALEPNLNPNIGIQIVPLAIGAYPAWRGPFELLEFADPQDDNMVYFENPGGDIVIRETHSQTAPYLDMFVEMQRSLPGPDVTNASIDFIIELMKEERNGIPAGGVGRSRSRARA